MINQTDITAPRILVIDDNEAIHEDFYKILGDYVPAASPLRGVEQELFDEPAKSAERVPFRIDSAHQGQEALELVKIAMQANDPYALAFVDIRMPPGWDGVETIERLWEVTPELQAVICTAYSDYSWEAIIGRLGYRDNLLILKKPFETVEVLQAAHALARKWALGRQARFCMEDLDLMVQERTQKLQREVEERARMQEALRISEERFSKAFRSSPMPMAIQRCADGCFVDANASFLALAGYSGDQFLRRSSNDLCLWEDDAPLKTAAQAEGRVRNHPCALRRSDGTTRNTVLWTEPMTLDTQPCLLLVLVDETEQLKMGAQLRQAQKLELVGRLAASIAHEFNNVLTVIQGHAVLLHPKLADANIPAESVDHIIHASRRAASFTRQLLGFSRKQPADFSATNLSETVESVRKMLGQSFGECHELKLELAEELPSIRANVGGVEQVLMNLTLNARDAMPHGGVIRVGTGLTILSEADARRNRDARAGRFVCLTVSDTGCGMAPEVIGRIFDPFFTTKDVGKGTGLGLSTVQSIVQQHQGWIEVSSEVGEGSTFKVFLPVWEGAKPIQEASELVESAPDRGTGEAVLLVEDEPLVREMARVTLEQGGYTVYEAADGREALSVWDRCPDVIDLVVTDIVMPNGISGVELARTLQTRVPGLQVICTSGYTPELIEKDLPANDDIMFLPKPYLPNQLLKAIRQRLDGSRPTGEENCAELAECSAMA